VYLRADTIFGSNNDYGFAGGVTGAHNRLSNYYTTRARMDLTIDTRTATEYGVVRTFADLVFTWTGGGFTGSNPTAYESTGTNATMAAPRSASTTRSSSSLGSRLVVRFRSSTRRGRAIRPAAPIRFRAAATTSPV
jgi:hypothetical protein